MKNKRLIIILLISTILLLIPLIAMQFSDQVNWTPFDFLIGGILLFGTGFVIELVLRQVKIKKYRYLTVAVVLVALLLVWAELAVGIFGTALSGH